MGGVLLLRFGMRFGSLWTMVRRDLTRTRGPLVTAGFGIAVGTAALVFFLALGMGARSVLLGDVFPIDQVELEPEKTSAGLLSLLGGPVEPPGIEAEQVEALRKQPGVREVYPKMRFRFPSMARGGKELLGHEIGTHEMIGDGIDPALVDPKDLKSPFRDPFSRSAPSCRADADCTDPQYCEFPSGARHGNCSDPVPALVSRYLIEVFDHAVAPSHGLPPVAGTLVSRSEGIPFEMTLGNSLLGVARIGKERKVKVRVVGVSSKAIDLGVTLPVGVVQRWNAEYAGEASGKRYSSVVIKVAHPSDASRLIDVGATQGLVPRDTRARDVSVLITGVLALLVLAVGVVMTVAALNIAYTFRTLVAEREHEFGLYRALGASARDVRRFLLALALVVGASAGAGGAVTAWLLAFVADWRAARDLPDFPFKPDSFFVFPAWLWLLALGFAAAFSLLGAVGPARRAGRTDPARALSRSL